MLVILCVLTLSLIFLTVKKYLSAYDDGIPRIPGALPLIGHAHMFWGDSIHMLEVLRNFAKETVKNGGCASISLGPVKYYHLTDPDDCAMLMNTCFDKHYVYSFAKDWIGDGLITAGATIWRKHQKILYPMFNQKVQHGFIGIFNKQAKALVNCFEPHVGKDPFDIEPPIFLIALETICQTALGMDVAEHMSHNKNYVDAVNGIFDVFVKRFKNTLLHLEFIYNWSSLKKQQDQHVNIVNPFADKFIEMRKLEDFDQNKELQDISGEFKPFVHWVLKAGTKNDFTHKEIRDEINTLILSGYDTSAIILMNALINLGHRQDIQEKVYTELHEVFGDSDRDVDKDDLVKLVYVEAVLQETLRLYPVSPLLGRYTHVDLKLKNYTIPAGSNCFVSAFGLHHHPAWGPDVDEFRPERWLEGPPVNPNLFVGFGLGKRDCIGKTYALMSMKTSISHVLRRYRVTADLNKVVFKFSVLMRPDSGQNISLTLRK